VLKRLNGGPGAVAEDAVGVDRPVAAQYRREAALDIRDRLAGVANRERKAYR
jgi:hypothetical protein